MSSNPFAALFNVSNVENPSSSVEDNVNIEVEQGESSNNDDILINNAIEDIFGFTICVNRIEPFRKNIPLVYLEESVEDSDYLSVSLLRTALFDRLMIENPREFVIPKNDNQIDSTFVENEVLTYLFHCYERLKYYNNNNIDNIKDSIKSLIFQNAVLFLQQPIVFLEQNGKDQCINLIKNFELPCESFFEEISNFYNNEGKFNISIANITLTQFLCRR